MKPGLDKLEVAVGLGPKLQKEDVLLMDVLLKLTANGGQATVGEKTKLATGFKFTKTVCVMESIQKAVVAISLTE